MIKSGTGKKSFYFRGCGWSKKDISWCKEDQKWIIAMDQLFQLMYRKDAPGYAFGKGKGACARIQETDDTGKPIMKDLLGSFKKMLLSSANP